MNQQGGVSGRTGRRTEERANIKRKIPGDARYQYEDNE